MSLDTQEYISKSCIWHLTLLSDPVFKSYSFSNTSKLRQRCVSTIETQKESQWAGNCLLVGCLTSQQHASVSQGRICSDNFTCCHTEIEVADQTFYLTQSQYTDTGPTSPSTDPMTAGAWQGSQFLSHWYDSTPKKNPVASRIRTRDLPLSRRTPYH